MPVSRTRARPWPRLRAACPAGIAYFENVGSPVLAVLPAQPSGPHQSLWPRVAVRHHDSSTLMTPWMAEVPLL